MPDDEPTFKQFQFGGPDTPPVAVPGEDANIGDAIATFNELKEAQRTARRPENEHFVSALEEAFREQKKHLQRATALSILSGALEALEEAVERAEEEGNPEPFEESALFERDEEDGQFAPAVDLEQKVEDWQDKPPTFFQDTAEGILVGDEDRQWSEWAEWAATHVMYWAARDVNKQFWKEGTDPDNVAEEEWAHRFNEQLTAEKYYTDAVQLLAGKLGGTVAESMKEAARNEGLSIVEIERLFGLQEDEDDAPAPLDAAPSPEREGNLPTITAPPVSEGLTAIRKGRSGWPERDSQGNPRFVFERDRPYEVKGQFNVIVPKDNRAFQAAEAEMAQKVLRSFGHRTARLMLACSAHAAHPDDEQDKPTPIPGKRIREWLGVDRQTRPDLPRHKRDQICFDEIERLSRVGVQINVLSNIQEDGWADYDRLRRLQPVWHLNIHEHGQVRVMDGETRAENWQLLVEPSAWGKLYVYNDTGRQFGYFSRALLENIDWHRNPEGGDLAIELLKFNRFQRGRPKDLTVGRMLEICQLDGADSSTKRHRKRKKLEQAILEQERWGWNVDWTRWPDAYRPDNDGRPSFPRGYWKGKTKDGWKCPFHNWKVTFYPPEDMGALNSRAEKIDNSDPHELEPKGWPDRIRAILDATNYSQAGVARELGVSQAAVSFWKSGEQTPSPEHQAKLRDIERRHGVRDD